MPRFSGNDIVSLVGESPRFDLGGSYGPHLRLEELLDEPAMRAFELGYGTAQGDVRLRQAIAELYAVDADDVVTTIGGMHALFLLAFVLCDRGDVAVTTTPVFPPTRAALESVGADVRALPLSFDRGYRLDPNDLRPLLSGQTKLVSLASPQNPSGVAISADAVREVLGLMRQTCPNAYLVLDDIYREAAFGDDPIAPSLATLDPKIVTTTSLSKCYGAPGLRTGWVITRDRALREQLVLGKFNTVVSSPPVEEALALRVLEQRERILGERRTFLARCVERVAAFVQANAEFVEWVRPDAGAICCVRLKPGAFDDDAVERFYLSLPSAGVRVANGTWFGESARVFRLGFGHLPVDDLDRALEALRACMARAAHAAA